MHLNVVTVVSSVFSLANRHPESWVIYFLFLTVFAWIKAAYALNLVPGLYSMKPWISGVLQLPSKLC